MRNCGLELCRNPIIIASLCGVLIGATVGNGLAESPWLGPFILRRCEHSPGTIIGRASLDMGLCARAALC